jgi:SAM-dependent methyltransferase
MALQTHSNYGIDAPQVIRNFALVCLGGVVLWICAIQFGSNVPVIASIMATVAVAMILAGGVNVPLMIWSSKVGKFYERDRLIAALSLRGDEKVLDVGCGRGLIMVGIARKLATGESTGIDIWQSEDQSGSSPEATRQNAKIEGVLEKVNIRDGDARALPFPDASFDIVVSSLVLHNIYDRAERQKALHQIVRVLKPGGRVALFDIRHSHEYASAFRQSGMSNVEISGLHFLIFPPVRVVTAEKQQ